LHIPYTKNLICSIAHFVATSYPYFKKWNNKMAYVIVEIIKINTFLNNQI
jgi:hypothetical protein